ncbi:MAG TPA: PfkB family carbohydrate kinase [Tepidisphaeraceae bacterium]|jgi:fructokinase
MRPIVIGLGEILWDMLPGGKQLGGAPANFAYHAHALGAQGCVVSAVGTDAPGDEILERLQGLGLDPAYIARDAIHPTGTVEVTLDGRGVPRYIIREGVAWDFVPATAEAIALAGRTDAICFGSLAQRAEVSRATVHAMLRSARRGCLRVFDINCRQHYFDVI